MRGCNQGAGATATSGTRETSGTTARHRVHADWVRALVPTDLMDVRAQPVDSRCWRTELSC